MSNEAPTAVEPIPSSASPTEERQQLRGNLGTWRLTGLVLAFNAPLGVMAAVVPLAIFAGGGVATPLLFIGIGIFLMLYAVGYTVMARKLPRAGAFYTFVSAGLGKALGLATAFIAIATYTIGLMGTVPFLGISVQGLIDTLGGSGKSPWWLWAAVAVVLIGVLSYFRIDLSGRVLGIVVLIEVTCIVIFDIASFIYGGSTHSLSAGSFNPAELVPGGAAIALLFVFTTFSGFESTAIFRDEVRDPVRTVPRAAYLTIATLAIFYAVGSWMMIVGLGGANGLAKVTDPSVAFLTVVEQRLGTIAFDVASVLIVTSTLASLASLVNVISRYIYNLGYDNILPKSLGVPHPRWGSPHRASTTLTVVVLLVIAGAAVTSISAQVLYSTFLGVAGFSLIVLLFLAALAIAVYLARNSDPDINIWQRWIAPVLTVVLMAAFLVLSAVNLNLQTGSPMLSAISVAIPIVAAVAAVIVARVLYVRNRAIYNRIGTRE